MNAFVDEHTKRFVVEPIFALLPTAPSTSHAARVRPPSARALRDRQLRPELRRINGDNCRADGAGEVWRQMKREGVPVACCTVERRMRGEGPQGSVRGRNRRTTTSAPQAPWPAHLVERDFSDPAPNRL